MQYTWPITLAVSENPQSQSSYISDDHCWKRLDFHLALLSIPKSELSYPIVPSHKQACITIGRELFQELSYRHEKVNNQLSRWLVKRRAWIQVRRVLMFLSEDLKA